MVGPTCYDQNRGHHWPQTTQRSIKSEDENNSFGIFTSLWRKRKSKTSNRSRRDQAAGIQNNKMTTSSSTIFRLDTNHPSYPRFSATGTPSMCHKSSPLHQNAVENGNPLSLGVHLAPSSYNKNQRFTFATSQCNNNENNRQRHIDLINGRTPTMNRPPITPRQPTAAHPAHFHGTLSNRRRKPKKGGKNVGDEDSEEDSRLLLLPGDAELWQPISAGAVTATLGKQTRVSAGNQGVMPNPDDILPKQAWTDFSGADDWPNFVASEKQNGGGSNSRKLKRSSDRQVVKESPYSNGDLSESEHVEVNSISPPVPKERRIKPSVDQINRFDEISSTGKDLEVYESLVDSEPENLDGHDDELNNQIELNPKKSFESKVFSPTALMKGKTTNGKDSPSFCDNESEGSCCEGDQNENEKSCPQKFPPRPTQTFRSTKFISVTNSPKATPHCTTDPLDR